ncbi:MAG: hypothetical protein WC876_06190 [Candidatus Thermoplasmatota archaeon]|jgi:hypothetical protein
MRVAPAAAFAGILILSLAFLPPISAQTAQPAFNLVGTIATSPVEAGNSTQLDLTIVRMCANAATIQPEQAVTIRFIGPPDLLVSGPAQALFGQQVCASQPQQELVVTYVVHVRENATPGALLALDVSVQPAPPSGPNVMGSGAEVRQTFAVAVAKDTAFGSAQAEAVAQDAPLLPAALLALALLAAAFVVRRR